MSFSSQTPESNINSEPPSENPPTKKWTEAPQVQAAARALSGMASNPEKTLNSSNSGSNVEADAVTIEIDLLLEPPRGPSLLRNRNFLLLWIAQAITQTAQNTLNLALVDFVSRLTNGSPTQTALETVAFVLPGVFFSALAGVFVDRFNKRYILIATNLLRALLVPWLIFMGGLPVGFALPIIFLITCVFSTISQFFGPAEGSLLPILVAPNQLTRANSFFQITFFGSMFVGFSILAPLLPRIIGPENLFIAISVLYGVCFLLVWWLPNNIEKPPVQNENARSMISNLWSELKEGWSFIRREGQVWLAIIYLSTVQTALFIMTAIGIPYIGQKGLGQPQGDIIYILAPMSVGLGISVAVINKFINSKNRSRILVWATVFLGINLVIVGLVKPVADLWINVFSPGVPIGGPFLNAVLIIFSIPFGFLIGVLNISSLTILQENSPREIVGRVFAAYFTFANLVTIFPLIFAGALGDLIGLVPVFILVGLTVSSVGYYGFRKGKKIRLEESD